MIVVNIYEAKAKLSEYLEAAAKGERVLICNRNRPVAELRPVVAAPAAPRPIGGAEGFEVPASFFDPLPDDLLDVFDDGARATSRSGAWKVAEAPPSEPYGAVPRAGGKRTKSRTKSRGTKV
ncbi:MAG: type II toxin-antitoxin system prevent-host-death family antitoxin [Acidobacteria bacterium]|nr:type II toxin-antitoxin system prevent-host-death family antitoxin [Acidobacteriota bacterium]